MRGPLGANFSHIALRTPDVGGLCRFYQDVMGLALHERLDDGGVRLGWGAGQHALELAPGEMGLDHFAFEVPDPVELDAVRERLHESGAEAGWTEPPGDHPPSLSFHDPEGNRVELHGHVDRSGERAAGSARRPVRVQHVTLTTCAMREMVDFYEQVIGMRISDRMGDVFTWLRSNREHHTFALIKGSHPGLDHYSYDLSGWEDFKHWCDELAVRGVQLSWGPGRHGPGNNLFVIFDDRAGFRVELSAEMERFWDDRAEHRPRVWDPVPETVNLWGPTPSWRSVEGAGT